MENQTNQGNSSTSNEDKTVAFVSYLTLIGWIIALVMFNGGNKTKLGGFHIRQSLGLLITAFAVGIAAIILAFIPFIGWFVSLLLYLAVLAAWIMGFINALSGEMKPLPVVGELFQKWFASIAKE